MNTERLPSEGSVSRPAGNEAEETLDELQERFHGCWALGRQWREEVGELLWKIKAKCEYGEWGDWLAKYDLARSTADHYICQYLGESATSEPEEDAWGHRGDNRNGPKIIVRIPVRSDQKYAYKNACKADSEGVQAIFLAALLRVIGEQPESEQNAEAEKASETTLTPT